jgi:hypothetical protein
MNKKQITVLFAVLAFQSPAALAQWEIRNYPGSNFEGPAFVFEEVAEDIYQALGTGNVMVGSNTAIIINDDDVVIVDSNISPASAAALAAELKVITPKPIRYVINTHFHFDHAHGNQIYPADVEVIGHEYTYEMLVDGSSMGRTYQDYTDWIASEPGGAEGQPEGIDSNAADCNLIRQDDSVPRRQRDPVDLLRQGPYRRRCRCLSSA